MSRAFLDAAHVRVHRQDVTAEREVRHSRSRVRPDARQLRQVSRPAVRRDLPRGAMQVQAATVVPEPLPFPNHRRRRRLRERRRPSATVRATPGSAARHARPASAAASPPTRGSRTDRASAARGGRGRSRRTTRAVDLPRRRAYPGWRLILRAGKGQAVGLPVEVVLVWMIFVVVTAEILVTYSRLPARELYHVSGSGIQGGLSRAVLFTNFPVALVALAVLALVYERLPARGYRIAAIVLAALFAPSCSGPASSRSPISTPGR